MFVVKLFGICTLFAIALCAVAIGFAQAQSRDVSTRNTAVGTVAVKELEYFGHGVSQWVEIPGTRAVGFLADGCFITPFDNLQEYERSRTWYLGDEATAPQRKKGIRRMLEIAIGGEIYRGDLRNVGIFPMGLNLACVDFGNGDTFEERELGTGLSVSDKKDGSGISIPPDAPQGMPVFDYAGRVEAVFTTDVRDGASFISGSDILAFLREAKKIPRARPLLLPAEMR